jgi:hypothetical protein
MTAFLDWLRVTDCWHWVRLNWPSMLCAAQLSKDAM